MAPTLGYWAIRGLGSPLRYLLHYTGTEFEDKQYEVGPDPATGKDCWLKVKNTLGLKFPNLPYWIDGDVKLSESAAIMKHIARKHNLAGSCEEDFIQLDVADGVMYDIGLHMVLMCYSPNAAAFEAMKGPFSAELPNRVEKLSKLIENKNFLLGDKISYADFTLFELLERLLAFEPNCLANFSNLVAFHERVATLPAIAKYMNSPSFLKIKTRHNNRAAHFGAGVYE